MCLVSLKSMTYAVKAKKVLTKYNVDSEIIKLDSNMAQKGCSYGLNFDCLNLYMVEKALKENNVKYSQIITNM